MTDDVMSFPWVEKFKPACIDDCILPNRIESVFRQFIETGVVSNYTAVGTAGSGKTSSAVALLKQLKVDYIIINASENGNIDTIRTTVRQFASRFSMTSSYRVIILDEADYLTPTAQAALRGVIEEFATNCKFIFTANQANRIIDAIYSRAPKIDFTFSKEEKTESLVKFLKRLEGNLKSMGVSYDLKDLVTFVKNKYPDIRSVYNILQRNTKGGVLELNSISTVSVESVDSLIGYLKEKSFNKTREWVASNTDVDFALLRRELYKRSVNLFKPESVPVLIMILNDYDRHESFVKDIEIHCVAFCIQIMQECEFK